MIDYPLKSGCDEHFIYLTLLFPVPALPWAKAFGQLLNFNCALLLVPVCRVVLRALNSVDTIGKMVPLRKNIIFHKTVACVVLFCTVGHVLAHFVNYATCPYRGDENAATYSVPWTFLCVRS